MREGREGRSNVISLLFQKLRYFKEDIITLPRPYPFESGSLVVNKLENRHRI